MTRKMMLYAILLCCLPALHGQATSSAGLQVATITLSAAQISALHGSPVPIVAAPGTGNAVAPLSAAFQYKVGGSPYSVAPNSHVLLYIGQPSNNVTQANAFRFLDQTSSQVFMSQGIGGIGISPQATLENAPLMVENDSSTEWAGGDGTLTITVYYTVVPLQ
jgi:hypothetical protein